VVDLKAVRRELDASAVSLPSLSSPMTGTPAVEMPTPAPAVAMQPTVSSAEYLIGEAKRHPWAVVMALLAVLGTLVAVVAAPHRGRGRPAPTMQAVRIVRPTNIGRVNRAAVSPDGSYVGYVEGEKA